MNVRKITSRVTLPTLFIMLGFIFLKYIYSTLVFPLDTNAALFSRFIVERWVPFDYMNSYYIFLFYAALGCIISVCIVDAILSHAESIKFISSFVAPTLLAVGVLIISCVGQIDLYAMWATAFLLLLWVLFVTFKRVAKHMKSDGMAKGKNSFRELIAAFIKALKNVKTGIEGKYRNRVDDFIACLSGVLIVIVSAIVLTSSIVFFITSYDRWVDIGNMNQPVYNPINNAVHEVVAIDESRAPAATLVPPVFARDFIIVKAPTPYHVDGWNTASYNGDFYLVDKMYSSGIGLYLQSSKLKNDQIGVCEVSYEVSERHPYLTFDLGADSNWGYDQKAGIFCLSVWGDGEYELYNSGWQDYSFYDTVEVMIEDYDTVTLRLEEKKGSNGTLNIVLGDLRMMPNASQ